MHRACCCIVGRMRSDAAVVRVGKENPLRSGLVFARLTRNPWGVVVHDLPVVTRGQPIRLPSPWADARRRTMSLATVRSCKARPAVVDNYVMSSAARENAASPSNTAPHLDAGRLTCPLQFTQLQRLLAVVDHQPCPLQEAGRQFPLAGQCRHRHSSGAFPARTAGGIEQRSAARRRG